MSRGSVRRICHLRTLRCLFTGSSRNPSDMPCENRRAEMNPVERGNFIMARSVAVWCLIVTISMPVVAATNKMKRVPAKIQDEYIVRLLPSAGAEAAEQLAHTYGGTLKHVYRKVFHGFLVKMSEASAKALANHPLVEVVEENGIVELAAPVTESTTQWNLDRIDQAFGTDGAYTFCTPHASINPIKIYTFDTGMERDHPEFLPRAGYSHPWVRDYRVSETGYNFANDGTAYDSAVRPACEAFTHGTAVASVAAGLRLGVAKNAYIIPVRVVDCSGIAAVGNVVQAIDYIIGEAGTMQTNVANFSLYQDSAPDQGAMDTAVNSLIDSGFVVVTSANNHNADRCAMQSPARVPRAITVAGTTNDPMDRRVALHSDPCPNIPGTTIPTNCGRGSNFGTCVDVFAPGFAVETARWRGPNKTLPETETRTDTAATSYSAAIVSGVAARYLEQNPQATPEQVWTWIREHAIPNIVSDARSPNGNLLVNVVPECQ